MSLNFLRESPDMILSKIGSDLHFIDPDVDLNSFRTMTSRGIKKELRSLEESMDVRRKNTTYGSWLTEQDWVRDSMVAEALKVMLEEKHTKKQNEIIVPRGLYYSGVSQFGNTLNGNRAFVTEDNKVIGWIGFSEHSGIAKARLVMEHGTSADFKTIYVGLANGRSDGLTHVSMEHITESSTDVLDQIGSYCDSRWDGPWPWENEAPEKIKEMIERREEKNMHMIEQMQRRFTTVLREFEAGNTDQFELISAARDMTGQVDTMISGLGKLSASGITVVAQAKISGDEGAAEPMTSALGEPLDNAINALTDLKAALGTAVAQITGDETAGMPMGGADPEMDAGMGSPEDAMGANPMGSDAEMADVELDGNEDERAIKEL